jgi:hypothetical protein
LDPVDRASLRLWAPATTLETESGFICWVIISRFHLKTERESSLQDVVFNTKDRTMANIQNCDSYITVVTFTFVQDLIRYDIQHDSFNTYLTSGNKTKFSVNATCHVVDMYLNGRYISVLDTIPQNRVNDR